MEQKQKPRTVVKRKAATGNEPITINMMDLILQNIDRSRADIQKWWNALQVAEQISFPNRSRLYDLYERIEMDGHLTGIMQKRVDDTVNKELYYEVDGKRVEELDTLIESEKFQEFITRCFEKKSHGLVGFEFLISDTFDFQVIPRKHIKPEYGIISSEQNGWEGIEYKDVWNIMVLQDISKFGFLLKCCPYAILKSGNLSDLAQYIEIYGQPVKVARYDGNDIETKKELRKALKESGASLNIMLPNQATIDIIGDNRTNGNGQVHELMFKTCDNNMSVLVLGNTETTGNDNGGSLAKSEVHSEQQTMITKRDMKELRNILNSPRFKAILKSYGYPVSPDDKGKFVFEKDFDLNKLKVKKDIDIAISGKIPVADDYFYETYNIPKPDNYDEMKAKMEEEKAIKMNGNEAPPKPGEKKPKPQPKNQYDDWDEDERNLWQKFKDFFA
jgi:hypothetical protein